MSRNQAFTLVEIMIATALAMFLTTVALTAFVSVKRTVDRAEARLQLHQRARTFYDTVANASAAIEPTCAIAVITRRSDRATPATLRATPGEITLVFMRGLLSDMDFQRNIGYRAAIDHTADMAWECWSWDRSSATIHIAHGRRNTWFQNQDGAWTKAGLTWTNPDWFGIWAQPRRSFASLVGVTSPTDRIAKLWTEMDDNRWGAMNGSENIGDGSDLRSRLKSAMEGVEDLTLELVCGDAADGIRASDDADRCLVYDGLYPDGTATKAEVARAPRLLRLRYTLKASRGTLRQTFSHSFTLSPFTPTL